jgi:hypothetical protein
VVSPSRHDGPQENDEDYKEDGNSHLCPCSKLSVWTQQQLSDWIALSTTPPVSVLQPSVATPHKYQDSEQKKAQCDRESGL